MTEIKTKAYAKINLFLDITGRRGDGYHELNNIMQKIDLHDDVTVGIDENGTGISVSCDNANIPADKRNIAYKAAEMYLNAAGANAEIKIKIKKSIPVMAGLGGSSTDGAAVLKALDLFFGRLGTKELESIAAKLGADVPFCLSGRTAFCKGIGEIMKEIDPLPSCRILIIKPDFSCGTAEAYRLYDSKPTESRGEPKKLLRELKNGSIKGVGESLYNVFEVLYGDGRIENIKNTLVKEGALGASLSGSGSAVYGIFDDLKKADEAAKHLDHPIQIVTNPLSAIEKEREM